MASLSFIFTAKDCEQLDPSIFAWEIADTANILQYIGELVQKFLGSTSQNEQISLISLQKTKNYTETLQQVIFYIELKQLSLQTLITAISTVREDPFK